MTWIMSFIIVIDWCPGRLGFGTAWGYLLVDTPLSCQLPQGAPALMGGPQEGGCLFANPEYVRIPIKSILRILVNGQLEEADVFASFDVAG